MIAMALLIINTAKTVGVPGDLLLAICRNESGDFRYNYNGYDRGSPSFGPCQVKKKTAQKLGFRGTNAHLMEPEINVYWAAKFLRYQQDRYGDDWVKLTASYNSGSYHPSKKVLGCPRNLGYVKKVQKWLPVNLQGMLNCGTLRKSKGEH